MIEFICPGCTKTYEANRAFVGFETRCLRCGTAFNIPLKSGAVPPTLAGSGLPTHRKPQRHSPHPVEREPDFETGPERELEQSSVSVAAPPKHRNWTAQAVAAPPASDYAHEPVVEVPANPAPLIVRTRKKKKRIIGASVGGVLVVALVVAAVSGKSPKPVQSSDPPPVAKKSEPPPEPPPPLPKVYEPAPHPRAVRTPIEYELTAASLLLEYGEGPFACDQKYSGREVLVRGVFHSHKYGKVTVVPGEENSTPLAFDLLAPVELVPGQLFPDPGIAPGQPVSIRGIYRVGCRFVGAALVPSELQADRAYLGKSVQLDGAVIRAVKLPSGSSPFPHLVLEPPVTDAKNTVTCYFKLSDIDDVMRMKPGERIDVRGFCAGRSYGSVRLDNCTTVPRDGPAGPETFRVASDAFFIDYEADLVPFPRLNLKDDALETLSATAEGLGNSYQVDPRSSNAAFRNKRLQLSGVVKERHANFRMLVLQCGTETTYSVAVHFSPAAYARLPEDKTIVIRGVCAGLAGGYVRIESGEYTETKTGLEALRTEAAFLPYQLGKEHIVDHISPGRTKDSAIKRMAIRFADGELIQVVLLKVGTYPGYSFFKDPTLVPKWSPQPLPKLAPQVRRYRVRDGVVEIGQLYQPSPEKREFQEFWEPVLKTGLKAGQSWSVRFPDGKMATYAVASFSKSAAGRDQLEIKKVLRDLADPTRWEETGVTYERGTGEVRRIVTIRTERGEAIVTGESRLVPDASAETELKTAPTPKY